MPDTADAAETRALTAAALGAVLGIALSVFMAALYVVAAGHTESAEARSYVLTFAIAVPAALVAVTLARHRLAALVDVQLVVLLGMGLAAVVAGARVLARAPGAPRPLVVLLVLLALWGALGAGLGVAWVRGLRPPALSPTALTGAATLAVVVVVVSFLPGHPVAILRVLLAVPVGALFYALIRRPAPFARLRWTGVAVDAAVGVALLLVVSDVTPYPTKDEAFNHDFVLGPVDRVLHGGTVLVDTFSQYGVGMLYALAGWFSIAPLSYASFALLIGVLTAMQYGVLYAILRVARTGRGLAVLTVTCAVVLTIFTPIGSFVSYPSTGALRFGLGWLVVLSATIGVRRDPARTIAWWPTLILLAVASIWSFEAFTYAGAAYAGAVTLHAAALDRPWSGRFRRFLGAGAAGVVTMLITQVVFSLVTRAAAGQWPSWNGYLDFLRLYSTGGFGQVLVYPWSWGVPMAMVYVVAVIAVVCLVTESRATVVREAPAFTAIAGITVFGIASLTYYVGRSDPNNVLHIAPMAITVIALGLGVHLRAGAGRLSGAALVGPVALAAWVGALMVVSASPKVEQRIGRTAAAHLPRLDRPLDRLWSHPPVQDRRVLAAERLLADHVPPGVKPVMLLDADLSIETLLRSGRQNAMPWSNSTEDGLVPDRAIPRARRAIEALPSGSYALVQLPPPTPPSPYLSPVGPAPLLTVAQRDVARRFSRRLVAWDDGIALMRLTRR